MAFSSTLSDVDIPEEDVFTCLFKDVDNYEDKIAFIEDDTERQITYGELYRSIRRVASALHDRGFKKKDILCIYSAELKWHAITCQPQYLICSPDLVQQTQDLAKEYDQFKELFMFGDSAVDGFTSFSELLQHTDKLSKIQVKIDPNDMFSVCFSSGTTGTPKGVMVPHRTVVSNPCQIRHPGLGTPHGADSIFTGDLPYLHIAGQVLLLALPMLNKSTSVIVTMHKDQEYKFSRFLRAVDKYKITIAMVLPHFAQMLLKSESAASCDLSSLTRLMIMGAPLGANIQQQLIDKMPKSTHVGNLYGSTEMGCVSHTSAHMPVKPGSVGIVYPNTLAKIMDVMTGEELTQPEARGELLVKSAGLFLGYLYQPEMTAETLDSEGFFRTGDVAHFDEDRYMFIVDRIKDVMIYNGSNIWPSDLEDLIKTHPEVTDVGVIGVPDPPDDLPKAFVVKKQGSTLTEEDIIAFVQENVSVERYLRGGVKFVDSIPRTLSGKILRRILREM